MTMIDECLGWLEMKQYLVHLTVGEWIDNLFPRLAWALRSTVRQATRHSPGQLALGRDTITQTHLSIAWYNILRRKYQAMMKANANENKGCI